MKATTGYEGKKEDEQKIPAPSSRKWRVELEEVGRGDHQDVYARLEIDGKPHGLLRLPDMKHLAYLRVLIHGEKKDN